MKKEIILRKAIIDNDCKVIMDNKDTIKTAIEFEAFCSRNSDICFVVNGNMDGYLHQDAMRLMLILWPLTDIGTVKTLRRLHDNLVVAKDNQIQFLIDNISWIAYNNKNHIPGSLKDRIIELCKIKHGDYTRLLKAFTKRGELTEDFVKKNKHEMEPLMISKNIDCPLELLKDFTDSEDFDWYTVSSRSDLTKQFVYEYQDKIVFEAILYHNPNKIKDLLLGSTTPVMNKFVTANDNIEKAIDIDDYMHQVRLYNYCKCGRESWSKLHAHAKLSDQFIIEHHDKLDLKSILKYYKLSDEMKNFLKEKIEK